MAWPPRVRATNQPARSKRRTASAPDTTGRPAATGRTLQTATSTISTRVGRRPTRFRRRASPRSPRGRSRARPRASPLACTTWNSGHSATRYPSSPEYSNTRTVIPRDGNPGGEEPKVASSAMPVRPARARSGASRPSGDARRVLAREARAADRVLGQLGRRLHPVDREVVQRGRADVDAHLLDRAVRGRELVLVGHVDAVEARRDDGRRRDADVHLGRARVEEHLHELARRVPADDRVVDDDDPLPVDLVERVELHADPLLAHALLGLDEGARDVAVLDERLVERDSRRLREADRRRRAAVGDADDEVGLGRRLAARAARPCARARRAPRRRRAASRAARSRRARRCRARCVPAGTACAACSPSSSTQTTSPGRTSRTTSAPMRSSAQVSDATTQSSPIWPSVSGRKPIGSRNATSVSSTSAVTEYAPSSRRIVFATASTSGAGSRAMSAAIDLGVRARREPDAVGDELAHAAPRR